MTSENEYAVLHHKQSKHVLLSSKPILVISGAAYHYIVSHMKIWILIMHDIIKLKETNCKPLSSSFFKFYGLSSSNPKQCATRSSLCLIVASKCELILFLEKPHITLTRCEYLANYCSRSPSLLPITNLAIMYSQVDFLRC